MRAIVFGGSGFVGSHVADALTGAGYDTAIYDLKESPYLQKSQEMVIGNILDKKAVEKAVAGCDVVYNFAGVADIEEAHEKPVETMETNILGNTIILEACRLNEVKRFVFASTIYVYSSAGSFYRSSKQACELIIEDYHEVFGLPYTILRFGSLYGPRADETNWVRQILEQATAEGKITRLGDGEEIREYVNVEDAARSSVKILGSGFENQCIVITGSQTMKVKDLMVMIREMLSNKIELEFLPTDSSIHYQITPYTFSPKTARRLVSDTYVDLGQGILQCLEEIYKKVNQEGT
jgi:UDP-glucose 4-epimerase